jgi:peptidoglycan hydrolase CwlO-like protein
MNFIKKIIFVLLVCGVVFQMTGCGLFSSSTKTKPPVKKADTANSEDVLTDDIAKSPKLKDATDRKSAIEKEIKDDTSNLSQLKLKCDSKKSDAKKDTEKLADADKSRECTEYNKAKGELDNKKERSKSIDTEIKSFNQPAATPTPPETGENSEGSGFWTTIIMSLVGLVILGGLGFLLYFIFDSIKRRKTDVDQRINAVRSKQSQNSGEIESLKQTVNTLTGQVSQQQQSISSLKRKLGEVDNFAPPVQQSYTPSQPKPEFPVMAEEYLAKNRSQSAVATVDSFTGNLIEDSSGSGEFCLIRSGNSTLAVPSVARFSTRSEYLNFYQNYYDFDRPAGGDIWIKSPAKVQKTESGWQLVEKGELEVR